MRFKSCIQRVFTVELHEVFERRICMFHLNARWGLKSALPEDCGISSIESFRGVELRID